jgi:hypothetical protein
MGEKKSLTNAANQRVAAARELEVVCGQAGLPQKIKALIDAWNKKTDTAFEASLATRGRFQRWLGGGMPVTRHYFMLEQPDHIIVTFAMQPERVLERGFNANNRGWLARIVPLNISDDGAVRISIGLVKWSANEGGMIWNGTRYIQLLDGVVTGLNGRYISARVSEEDHRFISHSL